MKAPHKYAVFLSLLILLFFLPPATASTTDLEKRVEKFVLKKRPHRIDSGAPH